MMHTRRGTRRHGTQIAMERFTTALPREPSAAPLPGNLRRWWTALHERFMASQINRHETSKQRDPPDQNRDTATGNIQEKPQETLMKQTRKPDCMAESFADDRDGHNRPTGPVPDFEIRVAQAAYFLAERRGFAPGFELEDWLVAEAQIRAQLASP